MRLGVNFLLLSFIALLVSACSENGSSPIAPAPDGPTFLYFYTEN